eukprot:253119_1
MSNKTKLNHSDPLVNFQWLISKITKKDQDILLKISNNILDNPKENKYRNLNTHALSEQVQKFEYSLELLFRVGFKISDNGKRLILDENDIAKMQILCVFLTQQEDTQSKLQDLSRCEGRIGSVKQCSYVSIIKEILTWYWGYYSSDIDPDLGIVLNSFHHLLCEHNSDEQFEEIQSILGECDIFECNQFQRNQRDRNKEENKVSFVDDIIDKIHCHFYHAQDIGFRLTKKERTQIETHVNEQKYEDDLSLNRINHNIKRKLSKIKQMLISATNNSNCNKFNSMSYSTFDGYDTFNCGQSYVYWKYSYNNKHRTSEKVYNKKYIRPTYKTFKEEMTHNRFIQITQQQWNNEYKKAVEHKNCVYARKLVAHFPGTGRKTPDHPTCNSLLADDTIYGISAGDKIGVNHLLSVIIYCNYDTLSYVFSKIYRRQDENDFSDDDWVQYVEENNAYQNNKIFANNYFDTHERYTGSESVASMKGRHCKFHHLAKFLNELIHVFSPQALDCELQYNDPFTVYHGISKKMKFIGMQDFIRHPLSTTSSFPVALHFTNDNNGMVLELNCDPTSRAFDCAWISDFPGEHEKLFINTVPNFIFRNIIDASIQQKPSYYQLYINALSIVNCVVTACAFQPDTRVIRKAFIQHTKRGFSKSGLIAVGAKPISNTLKICTLQLIQHELNRYEPQKYEKIKNIPPYIEDLLHYMCTVWNMITIDWELVTMEITETYYRNGYNGFLFLKKFFMKTDLPMIDLRFISLLFPNAYIIRLLNCPSLTTKHFTYIWKFLVENRRITTHWVFLSIECSIKLRCLKWVEYSNFFRKIGWVIDEELGPDSSTIKIQKIPDYVEPVKHSENFKQFLAKEYAAFFELARLNKH